jgi:hypothetical protein
MDAMKKAGLLAAMSAMAMAVPPSADARTTGKCGSEPDNGVFLYGMSQQTQSTVYAAAMSPSSNPDLAWSLWQPLSATTDTSLFGNRSVVLNVDPFQDGTEIVASMRADPRIAALGISFIEVNGWGCFSAGPPLRHVQVTEYRNVLLDHYFLSTSEAENASIDQGRAGPGWQRTGESFRPGTVDPCYGMKKVFRFYAPSAKSHFFTADAEECGGLRRGGTGWDPEGVVFGATMPVNGACVGWGETAVYRLYNNRWMFNDSNHRYTIRGDIYRQMIDHGWVGEGVAFCIRDGP